VALNAFIIREGRDGQGPRKTPFSSCGAGAGRGGDLRTEGGEGTEGDTAAAGAPRAGNAWDWFAAGLVQAELLLHFLARSGRSRIFRYTLAPEPLEHTDHRPHNNLERPLTRSNESSRERYTLALAGTAGLALTPPYPLYRGLKELQLLAVNTRR